MFITDFLKERLPRNEAALEEKLVLAQFWGNTNQLRVALRKVYPDEQFLSEHAVVFYCSDGINVLTRGHGSSLFDVKECRPDEAAELPEKLRERVGHNLH